MIRRLLDVQILRGQVNRVFNCAAGIADTNDRIADSPRPVVEVFPAAGAEVTSVRMDTKPIFVEVWPAAMSTGNETHRKAEHRANHIVDRVDLVCRLPLEKKKI